MSNIKHLSYQMSPEADQRWTSWIAFAIVTVLLASYAVILGHAYLFGPASLEFGDIAANALQIIDASHFRDIYGNYSRWGFNHPGPFFFYVYSAGETLFFNWLKLVQSPDQAHVLAGIIFQSLCFGWAAAEFARLTRPLNLIVFMAAAAFVLPNSGAALSSIWPPHVLLGPYFALIVSCVSLSLGNVRALVVAVLMTCILCHGHVAQPLMTIPMLGLAVVGYVRAYRKVGNTNIQIVMTAKTQLIASAIIIAIFLLPIIVDLSRCPNCNADRILNYLHQHSERRPNWRQAINYVASFFIFDHSSDRLSELPHVSLATFPVVVAILCECTMFALSRILHNRIEQAQYLTLRATIFFVGLGLILSLIWAKRITGPLFEFNAFFIYAIILAIYLTIGATLVAATRGTLTLVIGALTIGVIAIALTKAPRTDVYSQRLSFEPPSQPLSEPKFLALLSQKSDSDWPITVTLSLWLARQNIPFMVTQHWAFLFGWNHAIDPVAVVGGKLPVQILYSNAASSMPPGQTFDLNRFCRITDSSPEIDFSSKTIHFEELRKSCKLTTFGLSPDSNNNWLLSEGQMAAIQFIGRHTDKPVHISIQVSPHLDEKAANAQSIGLYINKTEVGKINVTTDRELSFEVQPSTWNAQKVVTIVLALSNTTPSEKTVSSRDSRELGIRLKLPDINYGIDAQ